MFPRKLILLLVLLILSVTTLSNRLYGQARPEITAFNSGEVSPLFHGRTDFNKYNNSCKTLQNMFVSALGPVCRRPGTKYIAEVKDSNDVTYLVPFVYSVTDSYVLEFGDEYMRVFRNGGAVLADDVNVYELATPFDLTEIDDLQYIQLADVMYIVDGNDPVQRLSRADHNDWSITTVDFNDGPFQDENLTTTTITITTVTIDSNDVNDWVTSTAYVEDDYIIESYILYQCTSSHTSGSSTRPDSGADWRGKWKEVNIPAGAVIELTAQGSLWNAADVNSLWQLTHKRATTALSGEFTADGNSDSIICEGGYTAVSHGTWTGKLKLENSFNNGTSWNLVEPRTVEDDDNMLRTDEETEDDVLYRFTMENYESGTCKYEFTVHNYDHSGSVKITDFNESTNVTGEVMSTFVSTIATKLWNKPYWSDNEGWPKTIAFHEERLWFGGNGNYPQTIWASGTSDYENMQLGDNEDDAVIFMLPGQNPIQWMLSQNILMIGTYGEAGRLSAKSDEDAPITNTDVSYSNQTPFGSTNIRAVAAGNNILYVSRDKRHVRELAYDFGTDKFESPDMSILSYHITESGITDTAFQSAPDPVLWCIRADGDVAAMTYERDNDVVGWSHITTAGDIESIAVIPGDSEDEVWMIVKRDINGITRRYVEQLQPREWGDNQVNCFFIDSGLSWDGGDAVGISAITKANPAVVTVSTWPVDGDGTNLGDGDQIKITGVLGMTQVNNTIYTISNPNVGNKTMELRNSADTADINSSAFTTYSSAGTVRRFEKTFTNLGHLESETCSVIGDGGVLSDVTVSGGSVTISDWVNKVHIGLPYVSILETLPLVLKDELGSLALNKKRLFELGIDFYQTAGAKYGTNSSNLETITYRAITDDPNNPVPLFTGKKQCSVWAGWTDDIIVYVQQPYPLPLTVRQVITKVDIARE